MTYAVELTPEQIKISNYNHRKAVEYFEWIGLLPKDRKPYEYSLHHKDETLRHTDIDRYIHWYGYDLEVKKSSKHTSDHMKGNTSHLGSHHSDETRKILSEVNKGNKNASGKRTEEQRRRISESLKGRTLSEEHKKKLSEAARRQWRSQKGF